MNSKRKTTSAKIEKTAEQITSAALMRPLQYDLQCPAAKDNYYACSRGTKPPWRSRCTAISRYWIAKHTRTTHTWATTRCRTPRENRFDIKTIAAAPAAHTRYLSSPSASILHGKHKVSCSGFLPNTTPMQQSWSHYNAFCSTTHTSIEPLQCDSHPRIAEHQARTNCALKRFKPQPPHTGGTHHRRLQPLYTEKHKVSCSGFLPNTNPMQHSCSHYNAICNGRFRLHYYVYRYVM